MEFEETVSSRKSFHSFEDREVEEAKIEEAVEVSRHAPSAWNLQPWDIKVLSSDEDAQKAYEASFDQKFIQEADKVLLLTGDLRIDSYAEKAFKDALEKDYYTKENAEESKSRVKGYGERDREWRKQFLNRNCMFFASTLINSLWNEGIGSCPVRGFDQEEISESLELEEYELPLLMIPIGYPDEDKEKKWRRDTSDILEFL